MKHGILGGALLLIGGLTFSTSSPVTVAITFFLAGGNIGVWLMHMARH